MVDVSEQLDECIYPKTEEVLYASRDDEVFDAVFLVEVQPDDSGNVAIDLYAISAAHGLQVTEHEVEEDRSAFAAERDVDAQRPQAGLGSPLAGPCRHAQPGANSRQGRYVRYAIF